MATCQFETVNAVPQEAEQDSIRKILDDMEDAAADLGSLSGLLSYLGNLKGHDPAMAGVFYTVMNAVDSSLDIFNGAVERLSALERTSGEVRP